MLAESEQHQLITEALIHVHLADLEDEDVPGELLRVLLAQGWQPPNGLEAPEGAHACVPPRRSIGELWAGDRHWTCPCGLRWSFLRWKTPSGELSGEWRCYGR